MVAAKYVQSLDPIESDNRLHSLVIVEVEMRVSVKEREETTSSHERRPGRPVICSHASKVPRFGPANCGEPRPWTAETVSAEAVRCTEVMLPIDSPNPTSLNLS